jgi:hypothetical protein
MNTDSGGTMRRPISLLRLVLYGTVTWLVRFLVSIPIMAVAMDAGRDATPDNA